MLLLVLLTDSEALVKNINFATVYEVQVMAVLILPDYDVVRHKEDCLQIVYDEALFDSRTVF